MTITYPKDTPEWLKDTITRLGDDVQEHVISTPADQFLVIKGETRLFRRLCEEIDALGLNERQKEKELTNAATARK